MRDIDALLSKVPRDPEHAAAWDVENLCAAWTPAEMRDAAHLCVELAAVAHRHAVACEERFSDALTFAFSVPDGYSAVFGGVLMEHRQNMSAFMDDAQSSYAAVKRNLRCAGALLWLAEQREAGHTR